MQLLRLSVTLPLRGLKPRQKILGVNDKKNQQKPKAKRQGHLRDRRHGQDEEEESVLRGSEAPQKKGIALCQDSTSARTAPPISGRDMSPLNLQLGKVHKSEVHVFFCVWAPNAQNCTTEERNTRFSRSISPVQQWNEEGGNPVHQRRSTMMTGSRSLWSVRLLIVLVADPCQVVRCTRRQSSPVRQVALKCKHCDHCWNRGGSDGTGVAVVGNNSHQGIVTPICYVEAVAVFVETLRW